MHRKRTEFRTDLKLLIVTQQYLLCVCGCVCVQGVGEEDRWVMSLMLNKSSILMLYKFKEILLNDFRSNRFFYIDNGLIKKGDNNGFLLLDIIRMPTTICMRNVHHINVTRSYNTYNIIHLSSCYIIIKGTIKSRLKVLYWILWQNIFIVFFFLCGVAFGLDIWLRDDALLRL